MIRLKPDNMAVEESLQVIVAMIFQILLIEDGIDIGKRFYASTAGFVVDDSYLIRAVRQRDAVKTVDLTSQRQLEGVIANSQLIIHLHGFLKS